jgi:hypothetical protein
VRFLTARFNFRLHSVSLYRDRGHQLQGYIGLVAMFEVPAHFENQLMDGMKASLIKK